MLGRGSRRSNNVIIAIIIVIIKIRRATGRVRSLILACFLFLVSCFLFCSCFLSRAWPPWGHRPPKVVCLSRQSLSRPLLGPIFPHFWASREVSKNPPRAARALGVLAFETDCSLSGLHPIWIASYLLCFSSLGCFPAGYLPYRR